MLMNPIDSSILEQHYFEDDTGEPQGKKLTERSGKNQTLTVVNRLTKIKKKEGMHCNLHMDEAHKKCFCRQGR